MTSSPTYAPTARSTLGRFAARGRYDHDTVHAILDAAFLCHVAYVRDGQPHVTPTSFWRIGPTLYWHGSAESGMLRAVAAGIPVCFTVSHVDGLVLSRVMSRHSFNYRSVVVYGTAVAVTDPQEKLRGMRAFAERLLPGRWDDGVQPVQPADIERITIARMDLREASAKVRGGPPKDNAVLTENVRTWAGHVPFKTAVGEPVPDPNQRFDLPVPGYLRSLAARFGAQDLAGTALALPEAAPAPAPELAPLPAPLPAPASAPAPAVSHTVTVLDTQAAFPAAPGQTLLAAALKAGTALPYGCASGGCGACKLRLARGRVQLLPYERAALPDAERDAGWTLACCAQPLEDCAIALRQAGAGEPPVVALEARVLHKQWLTHDIVGLRLATEAPLAFRPGQFVRLAFAGLPEREYSLASQPGATTLAFHIRVPPDGRVSRHVAAQVAPGDRVGLRGPYGTAVYHDEDRPLVAMAGGSGLAPIKSIVEQALARRPQARVRLYFGVRAERDLYEAAWFQALALRHPGWRLVPVLSDPGGATTHRTGYLADALLADQIDLSAARVYLAGPPVMVRTCAAAALRLGADPERIHQDAFVRANER